MTQLAEGKGSNLRASRACNPSWITPPDFGFVTLISMVVLLLAAGLCSLQQLVLSGNLISSLQPLSGLSALQVLSAAHNHITALDGIQVRWQPWLVLVLMLMLTCC